jgi:choline dehydrogenase-like flavoprotein
METRVVVIGSGAGGAAVAGELARNGIPTLVLEAGAAITQPFGSHVRNRDPSEIGLLRYNNSLCDALVFPSGGSGAGPSFVDFKVVHAVGGMLAYWTCNCPTPHPTERAPWISATEWDDILGRARKLLNVGYELGEGSVRQRQMIDRVRTVIKNSEAERDVQPMPVAAQRQGGSMCFSSADTLLANAKVNTLDVRTDLVCRAILHGGGRATGVVARSRNGGDDITVAADVVVIAAGVAGTPKLIAGSGLDAGPALGAYIFDHPAIGSRVVLQADILAEAGDNDPVFTVWIPYAADRHWHNQICRFPTNPTAIEYQAGLNDTADIFTFSAMDVRPENKFVLDFDRLDPFGLPELIGHYSLSYDDHRRLAAGLDDHLRIAAAIGNLVDHRWTPMLFGPGWSTHLMGSCRMGPVPDDHSCVDTFGKLWSYDNVYVAGNAIFAVSNAGNPTLTTVAMALRTADAIGSRWR